MACHADHIGTVNLFIEFSILNFRTIHQVWKSLLEETSRVAQSRLASSEVVSGQVSDSIKLQKSMRTQTLKKVGSLVLGCNVIPQLDEFCIPCIDNFRLRITDWNDNFRMNTVTGQ